MAGLDPAIYLSGPFIFPSRQYALKAKGERGTLLGTGSNPAVPQG